MTNDATATSVNIFRAMCVGLGTLTAILLVFARWYANYLPFSDDPAVIGASAGYPKDWFTSGFSRIFLAFPEWAVPSTDFFRPGVNAMLRLDHILFGNHYFLMNINLAQAKKWR